MAARSSSGSAKDLAEPPHTGERDCGSMSGSIDPPAIGTVAIPMPISRKPQALPNGYRFRMERRVRRLIPSDRGPAGAAPVGPMNDKWPEGSGHSVVATTGRSANRPNRRRRRTAAALGLAVGIRSWQVLRPFRISGAQNLSSGWPALRHRCIWPRSGRSSAGLP